MKLTFWAILGALGLAGYSIWVSVLMAGSAPTNEVTVVNHSNGPVEVKVRCFLGDEEPWAHFVLDHTQSEDLHITCPDFEFTSDPEVDYEKNKLDDLRKFFKKEGN